MKLRECCLEMKFSASNYSIHWFKNSIVASLARFRPKLLLKASNLFRTCLYLLLGGENFRSFRATKVRWTCHAPFHGAREGVSREGGGERLWRTVSEDKKLQRRETSNEEIVRFQRFVSVSFYARNFPTKIPRAPRIFEIAIGET